jgi:carbamoyl-phosphate synthase large subunit
MKEITVGISGINAMDNPGPGVGVARSLSDDIGIKVKVVGLAYDAMEPGIYLDWLIDSSCVMPYPSDNHEIYLERLLYIKEKHGIDFIIPSLDVEIPFYIRYAKDLEDNGIKTFVPTSEQFKLRGKDCLNAVADRIGIQIPPNRVITSYDGLMKAIDEIGLPIMVKGAFYQAFRANTKQEAVNHFNQIINTWGYPVIAQQVVTGDEMNVVGAGDGEGGSLGLVGIKKMTTTSLGKIWTGVTIKNERMLAAAESFIREYKWRGPFELECMVDADNVYLIEINPRFPAWVYFAAGVGVNIPSNLLRKAYGMPTPPQSALDYETGKLFIRYTYEVITDMKPFRQMVLKGELSNERAV